MNPSIVGTLILVIPALALAFAFLWRRQRPVFWFAAVLILVGAGYLWATGAAGDIGRRWAPVLSIAPAGALPAR
jgi:hypothetical protein